MKNGFSATLISFNDEPGYYVSQYIDGEEVVKQFVPETCYKAFCKAIGIEPVIIAEEEIL